MSDTSPPPQMRSMRLIFEYDGDDVRLVMQQPVDLPATDVAGSPTQQAGYFVDTHDAWVALWRVSPRVAPSPTV